MNLLTNSDLSSSTGEFQNLQLASLFGRLGILSILPFQSLLLPSYPGKNSNPG